MEILSEEREAHGKFELDVTCMGFPGSHLISVLPFFKGVEERDQVGDPLTAHCSFLGFLFPCSLRERKRRKKEPVEEIIIQETTHHSSF